VLLAACADRTGEFDGRRRTSSAPRPPPWSAPDTRGPPVTLMLLATALAQQGNIPESTKYCGGPKPGTVRSRRCFSPELGLARAWCKMTVRDTTSASRRPGRPHAPPSRAGQSGRLRCSPGITPCDWADTRAVEPVTRLAAEIRLRRRHIVVNHARALAEGDAAALAAGVRRAGCDRDARGRRRCRAQASRPVAPTPQRPLLDGPVNFGTETSDDRP